MKVIIRLYYALLMLLFPFLVFIIFSLFAPIWVISGHSPVDFLVKYIDYTDLILEKTK